MKVITRDRRRVNMYCVIIVYPIRSDCPQPITANNEQYSSRSTTSCKLSNFIGSRYVWKAAGLSDLTDSHDKKQMEVTYDITSKHHTATIEVCWNNCSYLGELQYWVRNNCTRARGDHGEWRVPYQQRSAYCAVLYAKTGFDLSFFYL